MPPRTHPRQSYTVGVICALDVERAAVEATLDEEHGRVEKTAGDDNAYTFGKIGAHNVVVACLPAGVMGKVSAAAVAKDMMRSFPIKVGLMVGICGGVWSERADVRLGDVVVSQPDAAHGGVVQWDFGKMERDGVFKRTGTLNKPPRPLLNAVQSLKARHMLRDSEVSSHLAAMLAKYPKLADKFGHQGQEHDELFEAEYQHDKGDTCTNCDRSHLVRDRPLRTSDHPQIHYGNIASGDQVVKDGPTRDRVAREEGILCFEMEAPGLMDTFPCVVIRGVCDYADSHKNKRWQGYAAATAACYAKELLGEVNAVGVEQLGTVKYQVPFSMAGLPVADHFVQREREMAQLEKFFGGNDGDGDGKRRKVFVVHGLGGMGKTQLCVEYARQHKEEFTAVFWLDGSSKDALTQSLANAAVRVAREGSPSALLLPQDTHDVNGTIEALQHWLSLEANTGWLLVLDNVDREWQTASGRADPQAYDYKDYLNSADHGNVLITTRLSRMQKPKASLRMGEVDKALGREMLESRAGRELPDAGLLLDKLGGLPLALVQAGAYIGTTNLTVEKYIAHYDKTWYKLMKYQDRYPLQEYAERSVLTTWKMSYEQVRAVKPEAAGLLDQWAFFHPGDISYELIEKYLRSFEGREEAEECGFIVADELSFQDSVGVLAQYSLVNISEGLGNFSIHAVVHDWSLYNIVDDQAKERLCVRALRMIAESIPHSNHPGDLQVARKLLPHARMAAIRHGKMREVANLELKLYQVALFMHDWESSQEVEVLYLRALRGCEEAWGAKHTSTLYVVADIGRLYNNRGKLQEAEGMLLRALRGLEEALGAKHAVTLTVIASLGNLYWEKNEFAKAKDLCERAVQGYEEALGAKHRSTLGAVGNLGLICADMGKLREAEEIYLRALKRHEEALGAKHTWTLNVVKNLGSLYADQGKLKEGEEMLVRALRGYEEALGAKHKSTLNTVNNLGLLYKNQDKLKDAEEMYIRALNGYEETYQLQQKSIFDTILNLANLYADQYKMTEAEEMYVRALKGYEDVLGPKHTSSLLAVNNLGVLYEKQGKMVKAEEMYVRALRGYEDVLGPKHTSSLLAVNNLGVLYEKQGKMVKAEEMYVRALRGYEDALGPKHTSTLDAVNNLGILYKDQGKLKEAEKMYLRALRGKEEARGAKHTSTLDTVHNLGILYKSQGKMKEAEEMYLRALRGYEEALGPKHTSTLDTVYGLGNLYRDQGEVAKAKDMYELAVEGYEDVEAGREAHIAYIREQLSLLAETDGRAHRGFQAIGQQPLISPASDLSNTRSAGGQASVRHRKRDFLMRVLKK